MNTEKNRYLKFHCMISSICQVFWRFLPINLMSCINSQGIAVQLVKVTSLCWKGAYAPLTMSGELLVDGDPEGKGSCGVQRIDTGWWWWFFGKAIDESRNKKGHRSWIVDIGTLEVSNGAVRNSLCVFWVIVDCSDVSMLPLWWISAMNQTAQGPGTIDESIDDLTVWAWPIIFFLGGETTWVHQRWSWFGMPQIS